MKIFRWVFVSLFIALSLTFIIKSESSSREATVSIGDRVFKVEIANELVSWTQGLSGRQELAEGEGMLFLYPDKKIRIFWMKNMTFPLDLLWLEDNRVVGWQDNMIVPEQGTLDRDLKKYISPRPVNRVLELPAGTRIDLGIQIGTIINLNI